MTTSFDAQPTTAVEGFPLSPQQRDIWLRDDGACLPTLTCAVDVDGDLDLGALRGAVTELVARHEILRTGFHAVPGLTLPVQVICAKADVPVEELGPDDADDADALVTRWIRRPVDPTRESQLAVALCKWSPKRHTMLLRLPTLCADSAAMETLVREVVDLYRAGSAPAPAPAAESDRSQYADLSEWMNDLLIAGDTEAEAERWRRQSSPGAPQPPFAFGVERLEGTDPPAVEVVPVAMAAADWSAARRAATRLSVSLSTLLTACWAATLYRYTRRETLTLTVAADGRDLDDARGVIGPFTQHLPMRLNISDDASIGDLVGQVARMDAELREARFSFDAQRWAAPGADGARPAPAVAFTHHAVAAPPSDGDPAFSISALYGEGGRHPLELRCVQLPDSVGLTLLHCPRRYRHDDIAGLGASLAALIADASEAPGTSVGALRMTGAAGHRSPALSRTEGEAPQSAPALVHELFERHAAATPHATAVACEDGSLTYGELRGYARRVAARLADAGVRPGDLVPLLTDRGLDSVAGVLGILMAGAAYVPIDPVTPAKRLALLLDDVGAHRVLTQAHLAERLPAWPDLIHLDPMREAVAARGPEPSPARPHPRHPAYVIYTSGTTGAPKGVVVEHSQLAHYVAGVTDALGAPVAGGFAMVTSLASDLGNTALFHALCGGGTLHMIGKERASDPDALAAYLRQAGVDRMKIVPSHLRALLDAATRPSDLLPRVALVLGGEPCRLDLIDRIESLAPSCAVINHYGPTETTVGASTHHIAADGMDQRCATVPIGRPIGATRLLVLDPSGNPVPDWVPGEAHVAGPQVARGYLNRPELTAERFLPDPGGDGGSRMYRTGDRVRRLPGGAHEFLGRVDDQVKVRGFRVEPGEVETVIRTHPDVRDVAVLAREDAAGDRHLVAYLVASRPDVDVREFLRDLLPDHMIPASAEVIDALPLTPNGKVDRAALRRRVPPAETSPRSVVAPRDDDEARLLAVWQDTLRRRPLGVTDDFFEVGGNSLLAVRLIAQIRRATGHSLPLSSLFTAGTVEAMARLMRAGDDSADRNPIAVPIQPLGTRRPFFCVHAGGGTALGYRDLARQLGTDQPFHAMQSLGLDGAAEPIATLDEMARRYVETMREIQPEGPYLIGGWCLGGIIAYEMTRVLAAQGQRTDLLVLIDSESPATAAAELRAEAGAGGTAFEPDGTTLLRRLAWHFGIDDMRPDLADLTEEQQFQHLLDLTRRHDVLPADAEPQQLRHLLKVYKNNMSAVYAYLGEFTPGTTPDHPVVMYRPVLELEAGQDAAFGWSSLAGTELNVQLVPGDHHSVMRPPAVAVLGERLRSLLDTFQHGRESADET